MGDADAGETQKGKRRRRLSVKAKAYQEALKVQVRRRRDCSKEFITLFFFWCFPLKPFVFPVLFFSVFNTEIIII